MRRQRRRSIFRGTTLIELMILVSLMGILLSGFIGFGSLVRTSQQRSAAENLNRQEIRRFAGDLRQSVRDAGEVIVQNNELVLVDSSGSTKMTYRVELDRSVSRTVQSQDDAVVSRDAYQLGRDLRFNIESINDERLVRWTMTESDRPKSPIVIEAIRRNAP